MAENEPQSYQELKDELERISIPDKYRDKILSDYQKQHGKEALAKLQEAMQNVVSGAKLEPVRGALTGTRVRVTFTFGDEGVETEAKFTRAKPSGGGGRGKGGNPVQVNGQVYPSGAEACRQLGIPYEGRSAIAVLKSALKKKEIESFEVLESDDSDKKKGK